MGIFKHQQIKLNKVDLNYKDSQDKHYSLLKPSGQGQIETLILCSFIGLSMFSIFQIYSNLHTVETQNIKEFKSRWQRLERKYGK